MAESETEFKFGTWYPIESAPEKEWVLIYEPYGDDARMSVNKFTINRWVEKELVDSRQRGKRTTEVYEDKECSEREWELDWADPTHWMPLPPPPLPE